MYTLILAGGQGERLRPLTDNLPKPMVPVAGKPILAHQVAWLTAAGVTDVVFLAGYRWQAIQDYFGDGQPYSIRAHYSVEDTPLGRGGAIRQGMSLVPQTEQTMVVLNGDVITQESLDALLQRHRACRDANPGHLATIMVTPMVSPYGLVDVDGLDRVVGFREKVQMPHWINAGVYVLERGILPELPEIGDHENDAFPRLAAAGLVSAFKTTEFWRSVDSFKDLREAEEFLRSSD